MYKRSVLPLKIASLYNSIRSHERVVPPLALYTGENLVNLKCLTIMKFRPDKVYKEGA